MGKINVEGLGVVEIAGDTPTPAETAAIKKALPVDRESGAPARVRAVVGLAGSPESRLATLQSFYPDAFPDVVDPDNFVFTNPETGQRTLYNAPKRTLGDVASLGREGLEAVGGTLGAAVGAAGGAAGGPVGVGAGSVAGAGVGTGAGSEAADLLGSVVGVVEKRTPEEQMTDTAVSAGFGAAGQAVGPVLGPMAKAAVRRGVRGGKEGLEKAGKIITDFDVFGGVPTVGQATRARAIDVLQSVVSRMPGGIAPFARRAQDTLDKMGAFVEKTAGKVSRNADPTKAGQAIERGITGEGGFVDRFSSKASNLYNRLDQYLPANTRVGLGTFTAKLKDLAAPTPGAEATGEVLTNPFLKKLLDATGLDLQSAAEANLDGLPYGVVKELRSKLGRMLADNSLISEAPKGELKQLYAALSEDIRIAAGATGGKEALDAFATANAFYTKGIAFVNETLRKALGNKDPEVLFRALEGSGKDGATLLKSIRAALNPREWAVVQAATIQRLGKATAGNQDELGGLFSSETFLTNWNKLSPEAKAALFGTNTGLRENLDTVARAAATIRESTKRFGNPSESGQMMAGTTAGMLSAGGLGAGLLTGESGMATLALIFGMSAVSAHAAARLLTSEKFVRWLAKGTEIAPEGLGSHLGRLSAIAAGSDETVQAAINEYLQSFAVLDDGQSANTAPSTSR